MAFGIHPKRRRSTPTITFVHCRKVPGAVKGTAESMARETSGWIIVICSPYRKMMVIRTWLENNQRSGKHREVRMADTIASLPFLGGQVRGSSAIFNDKIPARGCLIFQTICPFHRHMHDRDPREEKVWSDPNLS